MKFKGMAVLAASLVASIAIVAPASAAMITYAFNGTFTGNRAGAGDFTIDAAFTGLGDTDDAVNNDFGVPGVTGVRLTSLSALAGGETFVIQTPATFFSYEDRLGLIFDRNTSNGLGSQSPVFELYDGVSSLPTTPANVYYARFNFMTDKGQVTISAVNNASFSAQVSDVNGAVPEPATWAMMLLGFGMIGFGMRYGVRRSNAKFDLKVKRIAAGLEV